MPGTSLRAIIDTPFSRTLVTFGALLVMAGCGGDGPPVCETNQVYDPDVGGRVEVWPDAMFMVEDAASPSGYRLDVTEDKAYWVERSPQILSGGIQRLADVTGFARSAGAIFRFDAPLSNLPQTAEESLTSEVAAFYDLSTDPPSRVPFVVQTFQGGTLVRLDPVVTLAAGADHLVVLKRELQDELGGCVAPAPITAELVRGRAPDARFEMPAALIPPALARVGIRPRDVVAVTVFRTHRGQDAVVDAAEVVDQTDYAYGTTPSCADDNGVIVCDTDFEAIDFRDPSGAVLAGTAVARYDVPVRAWIPSGTGPFPVVVFGHGLGGDRTGADPFARELAEMGIATVAIDALRHGAHPTAGTGNTTLEFLGVVGSNFDTLLIRGNLTQTYLDRYQLVRLIDQNSDIDGDGTDDFDLDRLAYWGISLGGMLGPGLLALEPRMDAALLSVGGGRLAHFVQDSSVLGDFVGFIQLVAGGADELDVFLTVAQTLVDDADPATWGDAVFRRRMRGNVGPHLLLPTAEFDEVVPPPAGRALAQGLGAVHLRPISTPTPPLVVQDAPLTATAGGDPIVGYFQFDRVGGATPEPAGHGMFLDPEPDLQADHFWMTWLDGTPEIIDPYPMIGTPAL